MSELSDDSGRACTPRALLVGMGLALAVAVLTPINSLLFRNSMLFGSYLPAVVVVLMAVFSLGINPLLGARRFNRRELGVVLILVMCLGGVVGQALVRQLPGMMIGPATTLATMPLEDELVVTADDDGERAAALAARILDRFDRDGDGRIAGAERAAMGPSLDDEATLDAAGLAAALARPAETYAFPSWIAVGVPERGRVDPADPSHAHVVNGYQNSLAAAREPGRVGYGDTLTVRSAGGEQRWRVLTGAERDAALAAGQGVLDPRASSAGAGLLRAKVGTTMTWADASYELTAIDGIGIPWHRWWPTLLAWSPLLLGAVIAMVAISGIVRYQWIVGERLSFPIAKVLGSLTDAPREGIWRSRGLWVAAGVVLVIQTWRTAYAAGWIPIDFTLQLDLWPVVPRDTWIGRAPQLWAMSHLTIWFTVVAMTFLITPEVGFSLWGTFVGVNLACAALIAGGLEIHGGDLQASAIGGCGVLVLVLLWIGRQHYWAVLRAAFGRHRDPAARAAAPYVWLLLAGCALMLAFMVAAGLPIAAGLFVILALLMTTVVLARCVAESGVPYASLAHHGRVGELCLLWFGAAVPAGALIPLAMIGQLFGGGDRERLLGHALNAQAIDHKVGIGMHKTSGLIGGAGIIGIVGAFIGMLIAAYLGGAIAGDFWPNGLWKGASNRIGGILAEGGTDAIGQQQGRALSAYAVGALVVAAISVSRLRFPGFPLHPIGFILMTGWVTTVCWFSYFVGWLLKVLVLRYGGQGLYLKLVPVAIGLVLGDAVAIVGVMILRTAAHLMGYDLPGVTILPS